MTAGLSKNTVQIITRGCEITRDINEFLQHFEGVKETSGKYVATCPICNKKQHLYITPQPQNNTVLVYCQHCKRGANNILTAIGLSMSDLHFGDGQRESNLDTKPQIIGRREHVYHNSNSSIFGKKSINTLSDGSKKCYWSRYENGMFITGLNGREAPLFDVHKLSKSTETLFFVEGEKDVMTLQNMGFVATTTPNGGGQAKWLASFDNYLHGWDIIVLTDNDDVGKKYGQFVASHVVSIASSVKIIPALEIYSKVQQKGDISDIVAEIGTDATKKALSSAVVNAKNYQETGVLSEFGFYRLCELTEEEKKPPEFIVEGMIPVGMTFLSGMPKIRKSFLALQLAAAVANGSDFLGHKTLKCSVAYFDLEGSKSRISTRASKMRLSLPSNVLITNRFDAKISSGLVDKIRELHQKCPDIRLVIIDTYSRARGSVKTGGANAYDADIALLEPVQRMSLEENIALVFIHHDKKGAGFVADSFERLSGTMGISGSCDSVLNLISDGKRFDGKANLEYTPRDARGGEIKLFFDENFNEWRVNAGAIQSAIENPIIRYCVNKAKEQSKSTLFSSYDTICKTAFNYPVDNPSEVVRATLSKYRDELYSRFGVATQLGVKSNGSRGVRLMKIS